MPNNNKKKKEEDYFILPQEDPKYLDVAKLLAAGWEPEEAVHGAGISVPDGVDPDEFIKEVVRLPMVVRFQQSIVKSVEDPFVLTLDEKRAYLRAAINTPPSQVTEDSPLCQEYKVVVSSSGAATVTVKMVDKLKAMDMDNRMAGHYDDTLNLGASQDLLNLIKRTQDANQERQAVAREVSTTPIPISGPDRSDLETEQPVYDQDERG